MIQGRARDMLGHAMVEIVDDNITYGLDDKALRWHKRVMIEEIKAIKPYPKSRRTLINKLMKDI
jgi:hypothetical protein